MSFCSLFSFSGFSGFWSDSFGAIPALDNALLTAPIIPLLEYVACDTVSTVFPGFPRILEITAIAFAKYGASSLWDIISTPEINPFVIVTLTVIGPLNPCATPVYWPSFSFASFILPLLFVLLFSGFSGMSCGFSSFLLPEFPWEFSLEFPAEFSLDIFGATPALDNALLTALIIPLLEYVAVDNVSTDFPGLPKILETTAIAFAKYGASSLWDNISTFVIDPLAIVTLTVIGPLNPCATPVNWPSFSFASFILLLLFVLLFSGLFCFLLFSFSWFLFPEDFSLEFFDFSFDIFGATPAFDRALFTALIIPLLEYVACDTVSTDFPGLPRIFEITLEALWKYGLSSWWDNISIFAIEPSFTVTLTLIGPLKPCAVPMYWPSFICLLPTEIFPTRFLMLFLPDFAFWFTFEIFAFSLEPACANALDTACLIAFEDIVAPATESTFTLPVLRILSITEDALLKYDGVSLFEITSIFVNLPFFTVTLTANLPP